MSTADLPLSNVKVIEFCQIAAGPFCGLLLADMGADVIKVEQPQGGDPMREWPPLNKGYSENFAALNRNKRSVVLDLKDQDGLNAARRLVLFADIVIENFRPGVMAKLGLDYPSLAAEKPSLIYCSISAFGQSGPKSREGGFDLTMQAMAGIMSVTGEPGGAPVKCGVPISDFATGLYAAFAIVSLLYQVRGGEQGDHIDVSMFGATLGIAALQTSEYFGTKQNPGKLGSAHSRNAPYQAFHASDGYVAMAAGNDRLWRAVCEKLDRPDLLQDARFSNVSQRATYQSVLRDILESEFAKFTVKELLSLFRSGGIPCAPINSYSEALAEPQVDYMNWIQRIILPNGEHSKTFVSPLRLRERRFGIFRNPPGLGAHTREVMDQITDSIPELHGGRLRHQS